MAKILIVKPMEAAFDRMVALLFKPVVVMNWVTFGLAVWLSGLIGQALFPVRMLDQYSAIFNEADLMTLLNVHGREMLGGALVVGLLCAILWVGLTWLAVRARFVFLQQVVFGTPDLKRHWLAAGNYTRTYFFWELGFGAVRLAWLGAIMFGFMHTLLAVLASYPDPRMVAVVGLLAFLIFFLVGAFVGYVHLMVEDFVLQVMFKRRNSVLQAWALFWPLIKKYFKEFYFYTLIKLLLLTIMSMAGVLFCCIASAPYLGAVALLPFTVFMRAYSFEFLAQFGSEWSIKQALPPPLAAEATGSSAPDTP